jgi:hypothetical protein
MNKKIIKNNLYINFFCILITLTSVIETSKKEETKNLRIYTNHNPNGFFDPSKNNVILITEKTKVANIGAVQIGHDKPLAKHIFDKTKDVTLSLIPQSLLSILLPFIDGGNITPETLYELTTHIPANTNVHILNTTDGSPANLGTFTKSELQYPIIVIKQNPDTTVNIGSVSITSEEYSQFANIKTANDIKSLIQKFMNQ